MNIATPQEQFASKRRLATLPWKQPAREEPRPRVVRPLTVKPAVSVPRKYWRRDDYAARCPWPCYADSQITSGFIKPDKISVQEIISLVTQEYVLGIGDFLSHRRTARLSLARHIAMYLARECTRKSYPMIGRELGNRDHSTVIHGVQSIEKKMAASEAFAEKVNVLRARLEGGN